MDLLPVENAEQDGGKSGDAIVVEFPFESEARQAVMIIDGGRTYTSDQLIDHVREHCRTSVVDLMICTHPDADHLNGLTRVVEELRVRELMIHLPFNHHEDISEFSNLEALLGLIKTAIAQGTDITEPFTGLTRFAGQLEILGPSLEYYQELLFEQLGADNHIIASAEVMFKRAKSKLKEILSHVPLETLDNLGQTSARNNSSVITLLRADQKRMLFTGDAGITALEHAAQRYEATVGPFSSMPISMFQVPHHGSRRNLGPAILDRILGPKESPYAKYTAVISSAKVDEDHPSPKIVNALLRRGCSVIATEGNTISYGDGWKSRTGWTPIQSLQYSAEDDDD
ncbi:ComEC/Rec2 family competence protein [Catellatospora bangladeshensis]|uniref:ComEC/Rec2 family competence protein n=1 Tax=Catellatospora bangladeshensis TaxID=310355 RepID=UPI001943BB5B|nr:hypothetical protein [Catellatospora bangladeshensis]